MIETWYFPSRSHDSLACLGLVVLLKLVELVKSSLQLSKRQSLSARLWSPAGILWIALEHCNPSKPAKSSQLCKLQSLRPMLAFAKPVCWRSRQCSSMQAKPSWRRPSGTSSTLKSQRWHPLTSWRTPCSSLRFGNGQTPICPEECKLQAASSSSSKAFLKLA